MYDLVFVASPLRADTPEKEDENKDFARNFCKRLWDEKEEVGFAPHLYFTQFLQDHNQEERQAGIDCGLSIMRVCERMYVVGPVVSEGMEDEIGIAEELELPIIYVPDVEEYFANKKIKPKMWGFQWLQGIVDWFLNKLRSWGVWR